MTVVDDLSALADALRDDTTRCLDALVGADSQFMRRQLFRAVFAEIEGIAFGYKLFALVGHELNQIAYSPAEVALLREEDYELDTKGVAHIRPARLPFAANLLFALQSLARALRKAYSPPTGEAGWAKLKESAEVRDRLMHPKSVAALQVSDQELSALIQARDWFWKARMALFTH